MRFLLIAGLFAVGCVDPDTGGLLTPASPPGGTDGPTTGIVDTGQDLPPVGGTWTDGSQQCVQFTGELDKIRADDDFLPREDEPRTLQTWARTFHRADQVIVGYGRPASRLGWIIGTDGGIPYLSNGATRLVGEGVQVADGEWHHFTATLREGEGVLYVDGAQVVKGPIEADTLDGDVMAGNAPTGDHKPFIGVIDDVRIFSRARLPQEFPGDLDGDLYADEYLALWWDFEGIEGEGFGTEVVDRSRTGIDGSAGGDDDSPTFPSCR